LRYPQRVGTRRIRGGVRKAPALVQQGFVRRQLLGGGAAGGDAEPAGRLGQMVVDGVF